MNIFWSLFFCSKHHLIFETFHTQALNSYIKIKMVILKMIIFSTYILKLMHIWWLKQDSLCNALRNKIIYRTEQNQDKKSSNSSKLVFCIHFSFISFSCEMLWLKKLWYFDSFDIFISIIMSKFDSQISILHILYLPKLVFYVYTYIISHFFLNDFSWMAIVITHKF